MSTDEICKERGVSEILHFTTNRGVLGVLATGNLKARARLNEDEQLKHIFQPNASFRGKDLAWLDYVNLSVSRINTKFFNTASKSWHKEKNFWWCILSYSPDMLREHGVWFTTTNNVYTGVKRAKGAAGLEGMFASEIVQWQGSVIHRPEAFPSNLTTCIQAEVLYPGELSTTYLQNIYVESDAIADELAAQISAVGHRPVPILVHPDRFIAMT